MDFRKSLPVWAAGCLLLPALAARADEWAIDSSVSTRLSHNDNFYMHANDPTGATYFSLAPLVKLSDRTESRNLQIVAGLSANHYFDSVESDALDHNFELGSKWLDERNQWSLGAASLRDSTLNSELASTGVVMVRRQRTLNSVNGAWAWSLAEATQVSISANTAQARYQSGPGLIDYDTSVAGLGLNHALSERLTVNSSYSYQAYRTVNSEPNEVKANAGSWGLGAAYQYSEQLALSFSAGRQKVRNAQTQLVIGGCEYLIAGICFNPTYVSQTVHVASTGSTYSANANYTFESGNLSFDAARGTVASGAGALLRNDRAAVTFSHRFDETFGMGLGAAVTKSTNPVQNTGETRFSSLSASLSWQLDRNLFLDAGYTRSTQRSSGQDPYPHSNLVTLALRWELSPLSRSK